MKLSRVFIVTVVYKNGTKFVGRFVEFSFKNDLYTWKGKPNLIYPNILLKLNPDSIDHVYYRKGLWCLHADNK